MLCVIAVLISSLGYTQEDLPLKDRVTQFDSLSYDDKIEVTEQYVNSDLNSNEVNVFILRYNELYLFINRDVYRKSFYNTSFNDSLLRQDSLFFLLKLHIYDSEIDSAVSKYNWMLKKGNRNLNLASEKLSRYYTHVNPKKALYYLEQYFQFSAKHYLENKGESPHYGRNVNNFFQLLYYNQEYQKIITFSDSILQQSPNHIIWLERKADAEYALKNYKVASKAYAQIYKTTCKFDYLKDLLKVYNKLQDTSAIVDLLTNYSSHKGVTDIESKHLLYNYLEYYGFYQARDSLLQSVLKQDPEGFKSFLTTEAFYYYSLFLSNDKQYRAAIKLLKKAASMIDTAYNGYTNQRKIDRYIYHSVFDYYRFGEPINLYKSKYEYAIGWQYIKKGRKRKALKHFKRAIDCYECNVDAHYKIGWLYEKSFWRRDRLAIPHYEKIISCDLYDWDEHPAITYLAGLYVKEEELDKAKMLLDSNLSDDQLSSDDYFVHYQIHFEKEQYEKAIKMIEKAIELEDNQKKVHLYGRLKEIMTELQEME